MSARKPGQIGSYGSAVGWETVPPPGMAMWRAGREIPLVVTYDPAAGRGVPCGKSWNWARIARKGQPVAISKFWCTFGKSPPGGNGGGTRRAADQAGSE